MNGEGMVDVRTALSLSKQMNCEADILMTKRTHAFCVEVTTGCQLHSLHEYSTNSLLCATTTSTRLFCLLLFCPWMPTIMLMIILAL